MTVENAIMRLNDLIMERKELTKLISKEMNYEREHDSHRHRDAQSRRNGFRQGVLAASIAAAAGFRRKAGEASEGRTGYKWKCQRDGSRDGL